MGYGVSIFSLKILFESRILVSKSSYGIKWKLKNEQTSLDVIKNKSYGGLYRLYRFFKCCYPTVNDSHQQNFLITKMVVYIQQGMHYWISGFFNGSLYVFLQRNEKNLKIFLSKKSNEKKIVMN